MTRVGPSSVIVDAGDVVVRCYEQRDRECLISILSDPGVMKFAVEDRAFNVVEAERFIDDYLAAPNQLSLGTVSLHATNEAIGFGGFRECRYLGANDVEFGWVLAGAYHGRGYATALGRQFITHALERLRLPRVLAACNPLNAVSEHILRDKLGMRFLCEVEPRPGFRRRVYAAGAKGPA